MAYKFFKSTTTRSYELVNGVSVAFELTSDNKDNVFVLTDIYRSAYKYPTNLMLIKNIGNDDNLGFGKGNRLNILYEIDKSLIDNGVITLIHPSLEREDFFYEKEIDEVTTKYVSRTSDGYLEYSNSEIKYFNKNLELLFNNTYPDKNIIGNNKYINKQGEIYELELLIENDKLRKIINFKSHETISFEYTLELVTCITIDKSFELMTETGLEKITFIYDNNNLIGIKKSLYNSSSYQYYVTHTFGEDNDENQYLEYIDNILGESTKLYLSGGTTGSVSSIRYPHETISLSYGTNKTTLFVGDTYEEIFYFKDGTLSCIKNSEGLIKTYSYKETFYLNDYKKLNVESFMLHEDASKNGEVIEGTLRGLLFNETSSSVDAPSGRKARVLKFNEYDTSTEDGIDYFTFNVSGGKLDTFSALLYLKTKSRPSSLASINVSFMMKFKNKSGELIYSTVMNSIDVNIRDGVNWHEQLIIGQAPSSFESVEIEMMNTNAYGEELYFDIVLYKDNLGSSYNYDINGNLFRMLKGKEVTSVRKSPNNRVEGSLHVVNSFDEEGRLIKSVDSNNKVLMNSYDIDSNLVDKTVNYKNGLFETEKYLYNSRLKNGEIIDLIQTNYEYDDKKRLKTTKVFEENDNLKSSDTINYCETDNAQYSNIKSILFQRGNSFTKSNNYEYDNKNNISKYYDSADTSRVYEFSYDSSNRLTSIKYDNKIVVLYKYDAKGNISSYHYSDSDREIRNVYNYSVNNVNVPYGAITSIYQDYYNEEEDYSEELYKMTYSNKKLTSSLNKSNGLLDGYGYEYDKLKSINKIENNVNLFTQDIRYNHFDQNDKSIIKVGNDKIVNIISDSNNIINKNIVALDYLLMAKDDSDLFWTFFVPREITINGTKKNISNYLMNKSTSIGSLIEGRNIYFEENGLRFMNVPYSDEGLVYDLGYETDYSLLLDLFIPTGNGLLFKIKNAEDMYFQVIKFEGKVCAQVYNGSSLISSSEINNHILENHTLSLNVRNSSNNNFVFELSIDGNIALNQVTCSSSSFFNRLVLNGFNSSINNKYGAIVIKEKNVFTSEESLEYLNRINEVYESRNIENKQSVISYNEEEYEYDEIVFNNTFTSRNGIKPLVQNNNDSFYSVRENFEFVPSLRRDGVGDNVYAIKGQELVYDFELDESGTVALRYKSISDKAVTLLQLKNNDLNIVVKKTEANTLKVFVNNVEKTSLISNDDSFENLIVTWSKVVASSSLESYLYNVNVYRNGSRIVLTSISAVSSTAVMKVYLGNDSETELLNGELLGYIDKLVYTDVEVNASKALEISEHLSHSGYCYNQYDYASRLKYKYINTTSNKFISKELSYNLLPFDGALPHTVSRTPAAETLSVDNIVKETKTYIYDDYKRVTNVECNDENISYTYDNRGYLTRVVDGSTTYTYDYDSLGNITNNNGVQFGYQGQLLRTYGTKTINYNGMYPINEVENGSIIKTYSWLGSKLKGITTDKSYIFDYNARGIRERKLVRNGIVPISDIYYFYDSRNRLVGESRYEYIGTGQKIKTSDIIYIYDATGLLYGFRYNGVEYYYDRDILGNINHIIHNNGLIVATYKYEAYGKHKVLNASGVEVLDSAFIGNINPIRYKGYYYDVETQLFYCNSRYYSPELGRFIQPADVSTLNPHSINGLNLYAYANNNPIVIAYSSSGAGFSTSGKMMSSLAISGSNILGYGTSDKGSYWPNLDFLGTGFGYIENSFSMIAGVFDGVRKIKHLDKLTGLDKASKWLMGIGIGINVGLSLYNNLTNSNLSSTQKAGNIVGDIVYIAASSAVTWGISALTAMIPVVGPFLASVVGFGFGTALDQFWHGEDIFGIEGFSFNPGGKSIDEWIKEFLTELFGG